MNDYLQQIAAVIRAVKFHSPTSYSWFGKLSPALDAKTKRTLTPQAARGYLLYNLQEQLYRDFYCQGFATPADPEPMHPPPMLGMTPFVEALSAANCGVGCYEDGWEVCAIEEGSVIVRKNNLQVWAPVEDCLVGKGAALRPGTPLCLRFPKELLNISPGYYMVLGNRGLANNDEQVVIRFYWNLSAEGAVPFVKHTTSLLNQALLPFRLKVLRDPVLYRRCDAAVIYALGRDYEAISMHLAAVYREVAPALKQATPALTKQLAPGLGLAEDTGYAESFGEHRCLLLAHALIRAYEQGQRSAKKRLQTIVDCFAQEAVSLEAPFLSHGSSDVYKF